MGNLSSCPIHHQVFGLKGAWAAPLKKSITSPSLSSISIQMLHSGQLCPVPLSPHLSMFSSPSHIQYQFESPVEHFLPLDITGLPCISAATQKIPTKASSASCCPIGFLPVGTISNITGTSGAYRAPNICQAHFPSPARGSQSSPQLGCLYKRVFTVSTHIREQTH